MKQIEKNLKKQGTTLTHHQIKYIEDVKKMFDINNRIWTSMSKERQEIAIERFLNRYYRERNDCYIEKGIND